jgi:phosphocarrier protein
LLVRGYESTLRIRCGDQDVDGSSILGLITLGAACGSELHFLAEGSDAEELIEALVCLVESGFAEGTP